MSKYRKGYVQAYKDLELFVGTFGAYTYMFVKALEIILK